jgi:hypothetical protein
MYAYINRLKKCTLGFENIYYKEQAVKVSKLLINL